MGCLKGLEAAVRKIPKVKQIFSEEAGEAGKRQMKRGEPGNPPPGKTGTGAMKLFRYYIDVITRICHDGRMIPLVIIWKDRAYRIDRIISTRETFSRAGGQGMKYVCLFGSVTRNMYWDRNRWFIESETYEPDLLEKRKTG